MKKLLISFILLSVLALSGCGAHTPTEPTPEQTPIPEYSFSRDNFPKLSVGVTTQTLGEAMASIMLGESRKEVFDLVLSGSTSDAWLALVEGNADIAIAAETQSIPDDIEIVQIARDGIVFFTGESNSVDSLTKDQLKGVFSCEITNWKELGGKDEIIRIVTKSTGSGSINALEWLLGVRHLEFDSGAGFDSSSAALCLSFYYGAQNMGLATGMKILSVDDIAPNIDTIASGAYPLVTGYLVGIHSSAETTSPERILWQWLQGDIGQAFVSAQGYVR